MATDALVAPLCDYCRTQEAFAREWIDGVAGGDRFWFICIDCLEDLIERENAVAMRPGMTLPDMPSPDRGRSSPRRPAERFPDTSKLDALRSQWAEWSGAQQGALTNHPDSS